MEIKFFNVRVQSTSLCGLDIVSEDEIALKELVRDDWEIKAATSVVKEGETVAIHYTLQRRKGGLVLC